MILTILSKYLDTILFMTNLCYFYTKDTSKNSKISCSIQTPKVKKQVGEIITRLLNYFKNLH